MRELLARTISPTDALHRQLHDIGWNAGARLSHKPSDAQLSSMIAHMRSKSGSALDSVPKLNIPVALMADSLRNIAPRLKFEELVKLGILFPVVNGKTVLHNCLDDFVLDRKGIDAVKAPNLAGVDLRRVAELEDVNFDSAVLHRAGFERVRLGKAQFKAAELQNASFMEAKLSGANFEGATLDNVNFRNATLTGASFAGTVLKNVDFRGANLEGADCRGVTFISCYFDANTRVAGADLRDIYTERTDWSNVDYDSARFFDQVSDDGQPSTAEMLASAMKLLGLEGQLTVEQVNHRFRELALAIHPDKLQGAQADKGGDNFNRLRVARDVLLAHLSPKVTQPASADGPAGPQTTLYLLTER
ncbi:pentapeptide repeat-containing protein [Duganella qianjiadongensis]|uniref:J domain-containing protein n=1 Tax=Duganella qianjiadongensis TaxID=2692176 RepID=A0ABW9VIM1_9BURK|nr:pentapeptide repeat-containing protein [Duganella qianjiadongensis]MYM39469.1 hypothetical protein [Duganella qianjiadongensis]